MSLIRSSCQIDSTMIACSCGIYHMASMGNGELCTVAGTVHGSDANCPETSSPFFIPLLKSTTTRRQFWQYIRLNGGPRVWQVQPSVMEHHCCLHNMSLYLEQLFLIASLYRQSCWIQRPELYCGVWECSVVGERGEYQPSPLSYHSGVINIIRPRLPHKDTRVQAGRKLWHILVHLCWGKRGNKNSSIT